MRDDERGVSEGSESICRHRCPNPQCMVMLRIPRQGRWHKVFCGKCGITFMAPPTTQATQSVAHPNVAPTWRRSRLESLKDALK